MSAVVLIVDDDDNIRFLMTRMLERGGYAALAAANAEAALAEVEENKPDLLITDMVMPGTGGLDLIDLLKRRHPTLKIIAMSGAAGMGSSAFLKMAELLGADQILAKPFRTEQLLTAVKRTLAQGA